MQTADERGSPDKKKALPEDDLKPKLDSSDPDDSDDEKGKPNWRGEKAVTKVARKRVSATLDDFELKNLLGKGAFGEVYLVRHKRRNRWMALKQMEKNLIESQGKQEHIKNEKRVLIQGKSPFLVRMHYSFQTKECLYIAMEYCPGGDLREFLGQIGTLEEEEAQLYFAEMIMAVHTLHKMGYIHRDLKPDNFLIDQRGHLKLADFGSVVGQPGIGGVPQLTPQYTLLPGQAEKLKELNSSKRKWHAYGELTKRPSKLDMKATKPLVLPTNAQQGNTTHLELSPGILAKKKRLVFSVVGSPDYMSPEVTSGLTDSAPKGYSEEVDWWSLGCVMTEMLLGAPPFTGATPEEIFDNIHNWKTILPELMESYRVYMTPNCFSLLSGFLCEPSERLGKDIKKLQDHPFFDLNWDNLHSKTPPFVPQTPDFLEDMEKTQVDEKLTKGGESVAN